MTGLIATSTALFQATTGFAFSDLITFIGSQIVVILGMGLGLLQAILPWVISIAVISVIVGLLYHGLRWLHILR